MKFIKLDGFIKDTPGYLVSINDIVFVEDHTEYRIVMANINGETKLLKVRNTIDEIYSTIETLKDVDMTLPGMSKQKPLYS